MHIKNKILVQKTYVQIFITSPTLDVIIIVYVQIVRTDHIFSFVASGWNPNSRQLLWSVCCCPQQVLVYFDKYSKSICGACG